MKPVRRQIPLYGGGLCVVKTKKDYQTARFAITGETDDDDRPHKSDEGLTECLTAKDGRITYLIGVFAGGSRTLVHELGHATFMILKNCGVNYTSGNHESYCYLLDTLYGLATEKADGQSR